MKKIIAFALSLVMVLSASAVAFATDIYTCPTCGKKYETISEYNYCISSHSTAKEEKSNDPDLYKCPNCGKTYDNIYEYNDCIESHKGEFEYNWNVYIQEKIPELVDDFISVLNDLNIMGIVKEIIERAVSFIESILQIAPVQQVGE